MYAAFFIYSISTIFSKMASAQIFLSARYICCFAAIVFVLGIYAVLWQQVLKKIPLSVAMANKPVALVFSLLWAFILFGERITPRTAVGIFFIFGGIVIVGYDGKIGGGQ